MFIRFVITTLVFLSLSFGIFAQDLTEQVKAIQIDEFGRILHTDILARLDPASVQLQNDPASQMYIIAYRDGDVPVGIIIRNFKFIRNYLTRNRGIDPSRLKFINGGETGSGLIFQLWYVPAGAKSPELLKPTSDLLNNTKIARKFDDDYYSYTDLEYKYWDGDSFSEFAEKIKGEPDSIAYLILYPEYNSYGGENDKFVIRKDSLRKINRVKADINRRLRKAGIPLSKIKIVNGGYRDYRQVELWILPKGIAPPAATPNTFPKTHRKSGK